MATRQTENYQLNLWEPTDKFLREEFNENFEKTDAAVKAEADTRAAAVDTLSRTVAGKADAAVLTALTQTVAGKGNCRIVIGSYVGTGEYGKDHPCSLTFDHRPIMVFLAWHTFMIRGYSTTYNDSVNGTVEVSWDDRAMTWYSNYSTGGQCNNAGSTYHYVALLDCEG